MTKAEQAALEEMNTTPEKIAAHQAHISQLLNGSVHEQLNASVALISGETINAVPQVPKYVETTGQIVGATIQRKRRKDAGIPRQKAPTIAQQPGSLSAEQASRLRDLIGSRESRRVELDATAELLGQHQTAFNHACLELNAFIDELQGKGK